MNTPTVDLRPGQAVTYHGSIKWLHGPMVYVGPCDCCDHTTQWTTKPHTRCHKLRVPGNRHGA
jgi:hypothetical protein